MIGDVPMLVVATVVALIAVSVTAETSSGEDQFEGPLLSTFKGIHRELIQHPDGTYRFSFSLPQQNRQESRDADGKVTGSFSFVDNGGKETSVRYDADHEGYRPESDAIPEIPEDTDDVQSAREEFLRFYEQTVKFLEELGSDEDDSDSSSSSEESDEYDYEDDEDDSSEEDDDDDDDSSSEEDSEEDSDEEDSDEEEEEEDDEEEEGGEEEEEEEERVKYRTKGVIFMMVCLMNVRDENEGREKESDVGKR